MSWLEARRARRVYREVLRLRRIAEAQLTRGCRRHQGGHQASYMHGWTDGYASGYKQGRADALTFEDTAGVVTQEQAHELAETILERVTRLARYGRRRFWWPGPGGD